MMRRSAPIALIPHVDSSRRQPRRRIIVEPKLTLGDIGLVVALVAAVTATAWYGDDLVLFLARGLGAALATLAF
jgi:hypothetical protein